jgi:hypothetical protein
MRTRRGLADWIYGTVLATSLVAAFSEDEDYDEVAVAIAVFVTTLVFWLAHVHAELFAERYAAKRPLERSEIVSRLRDQWSMVSATFPAVIIMLLAALGLFSRLWAERLAIGFGVGALIALGLEIGRREHLSTARLIGVTALNGFFGVVLVVLKILVH